MSEITLAFWGMYLKSFHDFFCLSEQCQKVIHKAHIKVSECMCAWSYDLLGSPTRNHSHVRQMVLAKQVRERKKLRNFRPSQPTGNGICRKFYVRNKH